jgi:hypothetical protein
VQANAVKRTPEQLGRALAAALAEVDALKKQAGQLQGGSSSPGGGTGGSSTAGGGTGGSCAAEAAGGSRQGMGGARKWALVGALQLAGLAAYFAAADLLGCA